jgi:hypothetical protein
MADLGYCISPSSDTNPHATRRRDFLYGAAATDVWGGLVSYISGVAILPGITSGTDESWNVLMEGGVIAGAGELPVISGEGTFGMEGAGLLPAVIGNGVLSSPATISGSGDLPKISAAHELQGTALVVGTGALPSLVGQALVLSTATISASGILPQLQQETVAIGIDGGGGRGQLDAKGRFDDYTLHYDRD